MTKLLPRLITPVSLFSVLFSLTVTFASAASTSDPATQETSESENQAVQDAAKPQDTKPAAGQAVTTEEWDITADKITRYDNPESIVAEGNIILIKRKKIPPTLQSTDAGSEEVSEWYELLEEEKPVEEVTPEDIETDQEPVYKTEITVKADWMVYDVTLSTIKARGNVFVEVDGQSIAAEQAVVNLVQ